jgi:TetR/AcrR family transcriptional repressor of mexCD-oprJ operon
MAGSRHVPDSAPRRRRADAERSIARILDATLEALTEDPDASLSAIAKRAGVVRATIYVHFPTREALLDAVTDRALREVADVIRTAEPERGEPQEALTRVVAATWRHLGRYHALVALNTSTQTPEQLRARHGAVLGPLLPLMQRGQAAGEFRGDVSPEWHLSMLLALVHAASAELRAGRVAGKRAEAAVVATVLGAITDPDIVAARTS